MKNPILMLLQFRGKEVLPVPIEKNLFIPDLPQRVLYGTLLEILNVGIWYKQIAEKSTAYVNVQSVECQKKKKTMRTSGSVCIKPLRSIKAIKYGREILNQNCFMSNCIEVFVFFTIYVRLGYKTSDYVVAKRFLSTKKCFLENHRSQIDFLNQFNLQEFLMFGRSNQKSLTLNILFTPGVCS
ncbi:hypothetical protein FF38_05659 [Lucilia cuprina]|uniref:Uncharacterized protein n=1 Tax=Lucilia cuprina TaxID=7375 RepID=A0A0L0BY20_LUCCU|nr:hypothetical protein FF38_05659 [Lucilia cuprina]